MLLIEFFINFCIFFIGACFGSFLTMFSYRIFIDGEDFIFKSSYCPICNTRLKYRSLVPVFSWLFQKGRCLNCKSKISIRYPIIEIINGLVFLFIYKMYGTLDYKFIFLCLYSTLILLIIIVDLERLIIPKQFQISFGILTIIWSLYNKFDVYKIIISAIFYFMIITALAKITSYKLNKQSIGDADPALIAICGTLLYIEYIHYFLFCLGIVGLIFGKSYIYYFKNNFKDEENIFPFAPAILIAHLICLILKFKF